MYSVSRWYPHKRSENFPANKRPCYLRHVAYFIIPRGRKVRTIWSIGLYYVTWNLSNVCRIFRNNMRNIKVQKYTCKINEMRIYLCHCWIKYIYRWGKKQEEINIIIIMRMDNSLWVNFQCDFKMKFIQFFSFQFQEVKFLIDNLINNGNISLKKDFVRTTNACIISCKQLIWKLKLGDKRILILPSNFTRTCLWMSIIATRQRPQDGSYTYSTYSTWWASTYARTMHAHARTHACTYVRTHIRTYARMMSSELQSVACVCTFSHVCVHARTLGSTRWSSKISREYRPSRRSICPVKLYAPFIIPILSREEGRSLS